MTGADPDPSIGEARWITFGESLRGRFLVMAHTDNGDIIQIISARVATRHEKRLHEEG
ncbi:MAG: BrnT family toxin [Steroidobacteraceae bacterium]